MPEHDPCTPDMQAALSLPDFTLEHLTSCTDAEVQTFLRECQSFDLGYMLHTASDALRERLFSNLSTTAQRWILEAMLLKPLSAEDVQESVEACLRNLAKLEAEGTVKVPREATGLGTPRVFQPGPIRPEDIPRQILEYDLAGDILALREPIRGLSLRELRSVIQRVSFPDLTTLVCAPPFDRDLMEFIGSGLSARADEMFREDCEKWTGDEPLHYFAAACAFEGPIRRAYNSRPTEGDYARLKDLGLRLLAFGDEEFQHVVKEHLRNDHLLGPLLVLGGLRGPWARRLQPLLSEKAWQFIQEDYQLVADDSVSSFDLFDFATYLPDQMKEIGHPLPEPIPEPLTLKHPLLGKLVGWFWAKKNRCEPSGADSSESQDNEPPKQAQVAQSFSLFSAGPREFAEFWLPWQRAIHKHIGLSKMDWGRLARLCDPCTAGILNQAKQWGKAEDIHRAVEAARAETLPQWKDHIRLAAMIGDASIKEDNAQAFAATLVKGFGLDQDAEQLFASARARLDAYDERQAPSEDHVEFLEGLGIGPESSLFMNSGESTAPFVLSPFMPMADQIVTALAIHLACRREGFLFLEEAAKTSGDSAIAFVADVITSVSSHDAEHLAQAYTEKLRQVEAGFKLLEEVLALVVFSKSGGELLGFLSGVAGEQLNRELLDAPASGWEAYADGAKA